MQLLKSATSLAELIVFAGDADKAFLQNVVYCLELPATLPSVYGLLMLEQDPGPGETVASTLTVFVVALLKTSASVVYFVVVFVDFTTTFLAVAVALIFVIQSADIPRGCLRGTAHVPSWESECTSTLY